MGDAPIEQSNAHPEHVEINGDSDPFADLEAIYPILLSLLVFLFLLTDAFLFGERMLEINLIFLIISILIYALYAMVYFLRNRNKFRVHFLLATSISGVLSFLFWNVYEIWGIEIVELLLGVLIASLPSLGVFFYISLNEGEAKDAGRGSLYSIPTCIAIFVLLAVALAPPFTMVMW
tara:strand:+ start:111 stop:641 length:531 start_codon:yes stop_codon:yes gene_type:complete